MIGLEYICKLFDKKYIVLAEELGVSKQAIYNWINKKKAIGKKHLPILSEMFGELPEEFFQKELTELDKLEIQKIKFANEASMYGDTFNEQYTDYEIDIIKLTNEIREVIDKKFDDEAMISHQTPYEVLEATKSVQALYEKLTKIIKHGGIDTNIIDNVMEGMINYQLGKSNSRYEFINEITKLVEQEQTKQT
ncbi:helix-turn-helix domain-containing protein [Clostridium saccharoperbutylacetonicum]|uniref:helix-turn-helix domain-containing protein n=1 Tax=Clostridium saccharoperbutylacetonicum TaxID=36745 RepID=UPI000983C02B|nr:helix-turn-helix domain-containing protein [Clostridium saccharoperbutylacetonicum]AQR93390.1 hypothetical protein CLSAP_06880 [Clostridium saccharoperbutylacetonicum]NSB29087.1 plasmid maintenance system antidote protein VapI [Clostridium saccharoperbutylacetonicum]